mgnify:CR=1 FL=1|jgi:Predicted metal-dependent hydrolase
MAVSEQLNLFDSGPASGTLAPAGTPLPRRSRPPAAPPAPQQHPTSVPPRRPDTLPPGCRWVEVDTPHQRIGFILRTSRRKTIGLTINDDGLLVTMPTWASRKHLHDAINAKASWILRKLGDLHTRQEQLATAEARWKNGGCVPYLGVYVSLQLCPELRSAEFSGSLKAPDAGDVLSLPLQLTSTDDRIRERVYAWLQKQAIAYFDQRLAHYCQQSGLYLKSWRIASPAARWGSCSSDGRIMLNWRLIHFPPDVVDYVVAHEVAHLRHMNHGPDFWREVERMHPHFSQARRALKPHHPGSLPLL